ncbi:MAG: hypothetical protein GY719_12640 [bacterium]|nr:hypothetical protein [bacterium]
MREDDLLRKLQRIEALFAGATTPGEREAADQARQRMLARLEKTAAQDPPVEYRFTLSNQWSRSLLAALLRRYGIRPYRYRRQRYTTVMARVPASFVDDVLWPEFVELDKVLQGHLDEIAQQIIAAAIHPETAEAEVRQGSLKQ